LHEDKVLVARLEVVVTQSKFSEVAKWCAKENVVAHTWASVLRVPPAGFDLGIVVSFGHLVPAELINYFPKKMINVHPSLLPRYRGAAPIQHALLNHEKETGVCVIDLHPTSFDKGNILMREVVPIEPNDSFTTLMPKLAEIGANQVIHILKHFDQINAKKFPQPELPANESHKAKAPKLLNRNPVLWNTQDNLTIFGNWRAMPTKTSFFYNFREFRLSRIELPPREIPRLVKEKEYELMQQRDARNIPSEARLIPDENFAAHADPKGAGTVVYHRPSKTIYVRCVVGWIAIKEITVPTVNKSFKPAQFMSSYVISPALKKKEEEKREREEDDEDGEEKPPPPPPIIVFQNGKVPDEQDE